MLLQVLKGDTSNFSVRGYHNTFYPVDLPDWLPLDVVKTMVKRFENYFLAELTHFILTVMKAKTMKQQKKGHLSTESGDSFLSVSSGSSLPGPADVRFPNWHRSESTVPDPAVTDWGSSSDPDIRDQV